LHQNTRHHQKRTKKQKTHTETFYPLHNRGRKKKGEKLRETSNIPPAGQRSNSDPVCVIQFGGPSETNVWKTRRQLLLEIKGVRGEATALAGEGEGGGRKGEAPSFNSKTIQRKKFRREETKNRRATP